MFPRTVCKVFAHYSVTTIQIIVSSNNYIIMLNFWNQTSRTWYKLDRLNTFLTSISHIYLHLFLDVVDDKEVQNNPWKGLCCLQF